MLVRCHSCNFTGPCRKRGSFMFKRFILFPFVIFFVFIFLPSCTPDHDIFFMNEPMLEPQENGVFELQHNLLAHDGKTQYIVPKGFLTDFASIPRLLWPVFSPIDYKTISPAILHDYLYACPNNLTRSQVDSIFYSSLIDNRVNPVVAYLYWLGVRLGGSTHFTTGNHCAIASKEYSQKISS